MKIKIKTVGALLLLFALVFSIGAAGFTMPYRFESGFRLYASDLDLYGKNITQFSTPVVNVSKNYTVDPYDYFILVDTQAAGTSVNLSIEHPGNKTGKELKFMRITDTKSLFIESARDFMGNASNWSSGWTVNNIFYFNYTPGSTYNLSAMAIKVTSTAANSGVRFALYNNSVDNTPYQLLDKSANTSISGNGWVNANGFNGTTVIVGAQYWIAFQTTNSNAVFYVGTNQSTESGKNIMTYNQLYADYGVYNQTVSISPFANNVSVLSNNLVPNIAINLAYIDGTLGTYNLTNLKYQHTLIQSDGTKWW